MDLYSIGDFTIEDLQKKVSPLTEKRELLRKQIEELTKEPKQDLSALKETISSIPDILDSGNFDDIKQLINELITKIEVDGDNLTIFWDFY